MSFSHFIRNKSKYIFVIFILALFGKDAWNLFANGLGFYKVNFGEKSFVIAEKYVIDKDNRGKLSKNRVRVYFLWPSFEPEDRNIKGTLSRRVIMDIEALSERSMFMYKDAYYSFQQYMPPFCQPSNSKPNCLKEVPSEYQGLKKYSFNENTEMEVIYYVSENNKLMLPQGTPLTIGCGYVDFKSSKNMHCSTNLLYFGNVKIDILFRSNELKEYEKLIAESVKFFQSHLQGNEGK